MKNCIENPNYIPNLRQFLPKQNVKQEMKHLDNAESGKEVASEKTRAEFPVVQRRRTVSEGLGQNGHPPLWAAKSTHSVDIPEAIRSFTGNSYVLLIGEQDGKAGVIVYGLKSRGIHQKALETGKKTEDLKAVCCSYVDSAPFLFFLYCSPKNVVDLVAYDVIEAKYKTSARPKKKCESRPIVNIGSCIMCFQRKSNTVDKFNAAKNRWEQPIKLHHEVDLPVVVVYDERIVYIFHGNIVQVYNVITEMVTSTVMKEYIGTGFGFVYNAMIYILSDSSIFMYDIHTQSSIKRDFPHLQFLPIHFAFVRYDRVFVLITNPEGQYEIRCSSDLADWKKMISFPKRLNLVCTGLVDYHQPCPIAPFETFNESLKMRHNTLS